MGELDELQRRLKLLEATESKQLQTIEVSRSRVTRVLNEGKKVGLVGQDYQAVDDTVFRYLATVAEFPMDEAELISDFGETIQLLRGEQSTLQNRLGDLNQDIRAARSFLSDQTDFSREATEQRARLKSIELFKSEVASPHQCPFCESELRTPIPKVDEVSQSLREVSEQLEGVYRDSPHIQRHITELEATILRASDDLRLVQRELQKSVMENEAAKARQDQMLARGKFLGRLSEFLESVSPQADDDGVASQIAELRELIAGIRSRINNDETELG